MLPIEQQKQRCRPMRWLSLHMCCLHQVWKEAGRLITGRYVCPHHGRGLFQQTRGRSHTIMHVRLRESGVGDNRKQWLASGLMTSGEPESNIQRCEPQLPQKWRSELLRVSPPLASRITAGAVAIGLNACTWLYIQVQMGVCV